MGQLINEIKQYRKEAMLSGEPLHNLTAFFTPKDMLSLVNEIRNDFNGMDDEQKNSLDEIEKILQDEGCLGREKIKAFSLYGVEIRIDVPLMGIIK